MLLRDVTSKCKQVLTRHVEYSLSLLASLKLFIPIAMSRVKFNKKFKQVGNCSQINLISRDCIIWRIQVGKGFLSSPHTFNLRFCKWKANTVFSEGCARSISERWKSQKIVQGFNYIKQWLHMRQTLINHAWKPSRQMPATDGRLKSRRNYFTLPVWKTCHCSTLLANRQN